MIVHDFLFFSWFSWLFMIVHDFLWFAWCFMFFMIVHDCSWLFMIVHDFLMMFCTPWRIGWWEGKNFFPFPVAGPRAWAQMAPNGYNWETRIPERTQHARSARWSHYGNQTPRTRRHEPTLAAPTQLGVGPWRGRLQGVEACRSNRLAGLVTPCKLYRLIPADPNL